MDAFRIVFLAHSGFLVELSDCVFLFDVYRDPRGAAERALSGAKPVYVFVSHSHGDHFNPRIYDWADRAAGYFVHEDCRPRRTVSSVRLMRPGDRLDGPELTVSMYGSTDEGGSFLVRCGGRTFFHAGDLNWWHWAGEPDEDNDAARDAYFQELDSLDGAAVDVAFFPVDARQAVAREWGVTEFLRRVDVKELLVPMHAFGSRWCPSYGFRWRFPAVPLWIPSEEGEELVK